MPNLKSARHAKLFVVIGLMALAAWVTLPSLNARQSQAPGGFLEAATSTAYRTPPTASQIAAFLPASRGRFNFPAPYNTEAYRLTVPADCGGGDCLEHTGYSDWRNINNHAGRPDVRVFISRVGMTSYAGPTLYTVNKASGAVTMAPIFPSGHELSYSRAEAWYWSAQNADVLYAHSGSRLIRANVATGTQTTVLDLNTRPPGFFPSGSSWRVWSPHSSDNDAVHVGTVRTNTGADIGCYVYEEPLNRWSFYATQVDCFVDKSGRYVMLFDNVDGQYGIDAVSIDLQTGIRSAPLLDQNGAPGHMDYGHGYMVGEDNWGPGAQALKLWDLTQPWTAAGQGRTVHTMTQWGDSYVQPAYGGALPRSVRPVEQQVMCSQTTFSSPPSPPVPREREVVCFRLDGSQQMLVVAPTMVDMNASGGGIQYNKAAKGNMDPPGEYYVWTANMGGNRLEAFLVRLPTHLLTGGGTPGDTTPPVVAMSAPAAGATLTGTVTISGTASDNVGVAGVQFRLDGSPIGLEDTSAPYSISWNSTSASNGGHSVTAVARDAAGNTTVSSARSVTVSNTDTVAPTVALSAPAAGATVSGSVTVSATASDNVGVAGVQFLLDGANLGTEDPSTPFSVSWNTAGTTNGTHTLSARVRDAAGNTALAASRTVTVANAVSDTTPPTTPTGLSATAVSSGQINLAWTASSDNVGVTGYRIFRAGTSVGTSATTTFSNTGLAASTPYSYTVQAYDAAGNNSAQSTSASATTLALPPGGANLVSAFALNEGSGTTAADASATQNNASLTSAGWAAGQIGGALSLSGAGFANAPDAAALTPGVNATFEAWIYLNGTPSDFASIFNKWNETGEDEYLFAISSSRNLVFAWKTTGGGGWGSSSYNYTTGSGQVPLTTWTHVSVVRAGTVLRFYINGNLSSSVTAMDNNPFRNGTNSLRLGAQSRGASRFLNGRIDEARIYNRALTLAEIQTDMTTPIGAGGGGGDTTAPTVAVTSPLNSAVLNGTVNVTATALDNVGVAGVQFQVDGVNQGAEDTSSPYAFSWNTAGSGNGSHTLRAVARDAAGNTTSSSIVTVTVQNGDTTAPTVSITSPTNGSTVSGIVVVTATAADNVGVTSVQFQFDGADIALDTTAPYSFSGNSTGTSNGTHVLRAIARDAAGNQTTSASVIITVSNASPLGLGAEAVSWDVTNATASNGAIVKSGGCISCDGAGVPAQPLQRGDSYVELGPNIQSQVRHIGFSRGNSGKLAVDVALVGNNTEAQNVVMSFVHY